MINTVINLRGNKTPCQECRHKKKKCNREEPCERCHRLGKQCIYQLIRSPSDQECLELAEKANLSSQIEELNAELDLLESTLKDMKKVNLASSNTPTLITDDGYSSEDPMSYILASPILKSPSLKKRCTLFSDPHHQTEAFLTPHEPEPWTLTFKRGELSFETHITTHSDMLNHLYLMMKSTALSPIVSYPIPTGSLEEGILNPLNGLWIKKYHKTISRNRIRSIRFLTTSHKRPLPVLDLHQTALQLIQVYLGCQHLQQMAIHVPTLSQFMSSDRVSPAIWALAAAVCSMQCRHVVLLLPPGSILDFGQAFFEQARDGVGDRFDEISLECLTAYVFMASYKLSCQQLSEAVVYLEMASRMEVTEGGVHLKRIKNHLGLIRHLYEITITYNTPGGHWKVKHKPTPGYGEWASAPDDTVQEQWFVSFHNARSGLERVRHNAQRVQNMSEMVQMMGQMSHQIQMSIEAWYRGLPREFKLSSPLFEEMGWLARECAHSVIPALTTLAAYDIWITISHGHIPKKVQYEWDLLPMYWHGGQIQTDMVPSKKWRSRIEKLNRMRYQLGEEWSDQEFYRLIISILPSRTRLPQPKIVMLGLTAAFNTIELLEYLRSRPTDCYFEMRLLVGACQVLIRTLTFKDFLAQTIKDHVEKIHSYLHRCLEIIQQELRFGDQICGQRVDCYLTQMEKQINDGLSQNNQDCQICSEAVCV